MSNALNALPAISATPGGRFSWQSVDGPEAFEVLVFDTALARTHLVDALCADVMAALPQDGQPLAWADLLTQLWGGPAGLNEQDYTQAQAALSATLNTMAGLGMVRWSQTPPA